MDNIYLNIEDSIYFKERFPNKKLISLEKLITDYKDMIDEIDDLKAKLKDLKQDIEDNYKRIPVNEQYEVYDNDFI